MPTPPNEKQIAPQLSTDDPAELQTLEATEKSNTPEGTSEVSMRLNLLGKLIIPPTPH